MAEKFTEDVIAKIVAQCCDEYDHALEYRTQREAAWTMVDEMYFGKKKKSLVTRANIHLPILQGTIETWVSKVDDPPTIGFDPQEEGDKPKAANMTGLIKHDARIGYWDLKDLLNKRVAGLYGRAIFKKFSDSKGGFTDHLEVVDPLDFLIDPQAGGLVPFDMAHYCGQDNIIRTKSDLKGEMYDQAAVTAIMGKIQSDGDKDNRYGSMQARRAALGLSNAVYLSQDASKLVEWLTTYEGQRVYCFFSREYRRAVRTVPLKELYTSEEFHFASWAVFPHPFEFWTPGIGEIFKEINQVQNILVSQVLDNNAFRNYGMTIYDATKITNPAQLDPKPMGKIAVNGNPNEVIKHRDFPSIVDSLDLMTFLNTSFSRDSGVNDQSKGMPNSKRMSATEFAGLLDQVADRFFTVNRTYRECYRRIGELYAAGVEENMTQEKRIKVLGTKGFEWRKVTKTDLKGNFDVIVTTDSTEEASKQIERASFQVYMKDARQNSRLNQRFLDEKEAMIMGFTDDELGRLLNPDMEGDWEILAEAAAENEEMLSKKVDPNKGATAGHIQKHLDFARKTNGLKPEIIDRIIAHANEEVDYAAENEIRKAKEVVEKKANELLMANQPAPQPQAPAPGALPPGATQITQVPPDPSMGMPPQGMPPMDPGMMMPPPGADPMSEAVRQMAIQGAPQPLAQ